MTAHAIDDDGAPAHSPLERHWKPIAGLLGVLAVFGWGIASPSDRLNKLESAAVRQATRDSLQDVAIEALARDMNGKLRSLEGTTNGLAIAQCITERNRAVLAALECSRRGVR